MSLANHLLRSVALAALLALPATAQEATDAPAEEAPATEAPARDVTADTVVATVNGVDITLGHMIVMRSRLPEQYQALPDEVLFSGILDQIIQQIALAAGMDGKLSRGSELALENERRAFIAAEALTSVAEGAVTDESLQALYAERYSEAAPSQEYDASHILVETEEEALAIKAEIDGGADFAELARTRSTGPSGPNGGNLGWFTEGMMVEPFEQAVLQLEAGEVSGPVQTQFGWHVIRLNAVRLKEAPPLGEVEAELAEELQRQAIDTTVAAATDAAEIVRDDAGIDPAVLRNLDLIAE